MLEGVRQLIGLHSSSKDVEQDSGVDRTGVYVLGQKAARGPDGFRGDAVVQRGQLIEGLDLLERVVVNDGWPVERSAPVDDSVTDCTDGALGGAGELGDRGCDRLGPALRGSVVRTPAGRG